MTSEGQIEKYKFDEIIQDDKLNDVADKFRAYRLNAETTAAKLKEANMVIDQLKAEINISKNMEASLRSQITLAENRLIYLQKTKMKFLTVADRLRQSERASLEIERKIGQIEEVIQNFKDECQNLYKTASNEKSLLIKCEDLKFKLENKEREMNLLKVENETLSKQKLETEITAEQNCKILENVTDDLRRAVTEMQVQYDQTLQLYKKQLEDKELTLKEYERERKSILEEFAMPNTSESSSDVAWADSAKVSIPDRPMKRSMDSQCDGGKEPLPTSAGSQGNKSFNRRTKLFGPKLEKGCKQKPQLDFLISNSTSATPSDAPPLKRRLFSMNYNYYVN